MSEPSVPDAIPESLARPDVQGASTISGRAQPSLLSNSFARLGSDVWTLAMSLVATTVTARALGPAGRGFYSTLVLLAGAFMCVFSAGLPEAAAVLAGRARFALRDAAAATMAAIIPLSVAATGAFVPVASWALEPSTSDDRLAIIIGALQVGIMIWYITFVWLLIAQERILSVTVTAIALAGVTTFGIWALVGYADFGRAGATLGGLGGSMVALAGGAVFLRRARLLSAPRRVGGFLGPALRLGSHFQISNLLITLTARLDLLLVYRIRSPETAGTYSVALTIGALVGAVPVAVAYASFARLTRVEDAEARALTAQLFRMGVATAALSGAALAACTPIVVPLVFGPAFEPAIGPTLVLIPGGVFWSAQLLLCRAQAARGQPRALAVSFTASFLIMIILDLVLISSLGAIGAATGTLIASAAGLGIAVLFFRGSGWHWRSFVPGFEDLATLVSLGRRVLSVRRAAT